MARQSFTAGTTPNEVITNAMNGEPFPMELIGKDAEVMSRGVNQGIDSHMEGLTESSFDGNQKRLFCTIAPNEMVILLRRLWELAENDGNDAALDLQSSILDILETEGILESIMLQIVNVTGELGELLQSKRKSSLFYFPGSTKFCGLPGWWQVDGEPVDIIGYEGRDLFVTHLYPNHVDKPFSLFDALTGENLSIGDSVEDAVDRMTLYSNPTHQTGKAFSYHYGVGAAADFLANNALLSPRYADFSDIVTHQARIDFVKAHADFPFECKQFAIGLLEDHKGIHWCLPSPIDNVIWVYTSQGQDEFEQKVKFDRREKTQILARIIQSKNSPICISSAVTEDSVGVIGVKVVLDSDKLAEFIVKKADTITPW